MNRVLLTAAMLAALPGLAWAHAHLKTATPAVDGTVPTPPAEIAIDFTEGVEPSLSSIALTGPAGAPVQAGPATTAPDDNKRLIVKVGTLTPGTYTVTWHAVAVDTHKTDGSYHFTVAAPGR